MNVVERGAEREAEAVPMVLPVFPAGGLPLAESLRRKLLIRGVAVIGIAVSLSYLAWRVLFTLDLGAWWVSIPFLILELQAFLSLSLFAFSLWDIDVKAAGHPVETTNSRIA